MIIKFVLIALLITLLLILLFYSLFCKYYKKVKMGDQIVDKPKPKFVNWNNMTPSEQAQYIINAYFHGDPVARETKVDPVKTADKEFVQSLPKSEVGCSDMYLECPQWAANQECEINPEYMLYNCAKSCKSCALNDQQKSELIRIYNDRDPPHSVYHGKNYPGPFPYLYHLYNYGDPILGESLKYVEANPGDNV